MTAQPNIEGRKPFQFAGFTWPRFVARMACGPAELRRKWAGRKVCGEYYHAPTPNQNAGLGFYLDDAGQPFGRWEWADEVCNSIQHTGWFCDDFQDDKVRGIVVRLPHGRYLAGWSMGEGMASAVEVELYDDMQDAALAADSLAESVADNERDYRESNADDTEE